MIKRLLFPAALFLFAIAMVARLGSATNPKPTIDREIAITFDDLPVVSTRNDIATWRGTTTKLLSILTRNRVPVVGFVIGNKLVVDDHRDDARVELLNKWLDAGFELGNHTFSHRSLNSIALADYEADVLRCEELLGPVIAQRRGQLRYFRYPFLQTGRSLDVKRGFESFLSEHRYTNAPITIDNSDWIFARAYDNTRDADDLKSMNEVGAAYVPYMAAKVDYFEQQSIKLFDRRIKQILLVHANSINADHFGELIDALRKRGYRFIELSEALKDPAYASPDTFVGSGGISWLDRWALTRGVPSGFFKGEPRTPDFVMKLAGVTSE
jgi:peptidoglycan/xylan/chitin deacetylase (PgdA/CDA1 family)